MIEFASAYRQVSHATRNYFPLVTREPSQDLYEERARKNPRNDPDLLREQQLKRNMLTFFALSELALLTMASFGKPHEVKAAHRELSARKFVRGFSASVRSPYTMPATLI